MSFLSKLKSVVTGIPEDRVVSTHKEVEDETKVLPVSEQKKYEDRQRSELNQEFVDHANNYISKESAKGSPVTEPMVFAIKDHALYDSSSNSVARNATIVVEDDKEENKGEKKPEGKHVAHIFMPSFDDSLVLEAEKRKSEKRQRKVDSTEKMMREAESLKKEMGE